MESGDLFRPGALPRHTDYTVKDTPIPDLTEEDKGIIRRMLSTDRESASILRAELPIPTPPAA